MKKCTILLIILLVGISSITFAQQGFTGGSAGTTQEQEQELRPPFRQRQSDVQRDRSIERQPSERQRQPQEPRASQRQEARRTERQQQPETQRASQRQTPRTTVIIINPQMPRASQRQIQPHTPRVTPRQHQPQRSRHEGPRQRGGFVGTTETPVMIDDPTTISNAITLPHDSWVVLNGNIINMLHGGRNYTFRDSTGEITVDIGPKEWRGLSVGTSDNVTIYGEVKNNRGFTSIKVHAITGQGRTNTWPGQAVFTNSPTTVNEAVNLPHNSFVIINGNIINALSGRNNYTFRDSSGEIIADIGPKEWRGLSISESDNVQIFGEVKNHRGLITIKVHAIRQL